VFGVHGWRVWLRSLGVFVVVERRVASSRFRVAMSDRATDSLLVAEVILLVRLLFVVVKLATEERSEAVAVAKLASASAVSV
jgi:hypothetical protein